MKKILSVTFCAVLLFCLNSLYSQAPSVMWKFALHDISFGSSAMADLDGDGKPEIVFSCYWNDSNIYALHASDGSLLWKKNMGGCNDAAPIIYDVDGDGKPEVILGSSCNPVLTCFNGATGSIKWQTPFGGTDSPLSIGDINGDGKPDILVGDFEGYINCYTADSGLLQWRLLVSDSPAAIEGAPALVDVNADGHPDIIVCTWAYGGHGDSSAVYAYNGVNHKLLWKNGLPRNYIYHGAAFADVTEDGIPDIAVSSYDGHIYLFRGSDGKLEWKYRTTDSAYIPGPVTIGDINNDSHLDLVYANGYGEVDALDRFGSLLWSYNMSLYEDAFCGVTLVDVNNDDTLDAVFATTQGKMYALNGSRGNVLWIKNLRTIYGDSSYEIEHSPVTASFNNDDSLNIFIAGGYTAYPKIQNDFGMAYALKLGKRNKKYNWTMFQHDYERSNCVCTPFANTTNDMDKVLFDVYSYPNPFTHYIYFNFSIEKNIPINVEIHNSMGVTVKSLAHNVIGHENYTFTWNGTDFNENILPSGMYYCQIVAGNKRSIKKVVLMNNR